MPSEAAGSLFVLFSDWLAVVSVGFVCASALTVVVLLTLAGCEVVDELPVPPPLSLVQALSESSAVQIIVKANNFFIFTAPFPKIERRILRFLKYAFFFIMPLMF